MFSYRPAGGGASADRIEIDRTACACARQTGSDLFAIDGFAARPVDELWRTDLQGRGQAPSQRLLSTISFIGRLCGFVSLCEYRMTIGRASRRERVCQCV